jgi:hypothetical protein
MTAPDLRPRPHPAPPPSEGPEQTHAGDDLGFDLPAPAVITWPRATVLGVVAVAVLAGAFAFGYLPRRAERAALVAATNASDGALLHVDVVSPKEGSSDRAIALPGSV